MLDLDNSEIAVVGDQIFTDVIGANRMKMYSILVEPIEEKDILVTLIKRPIENYIKKRFIENIKKWNFCYIFLIQNEVKNIKTYDKKVEEK